MSADNLRIEIALNGFWSGIVNADRSVFGAAEQVGAEQTSARIYQQSDPKEGYAGSDYRFAQIVG